MTFGIMVTNTTTGKYATTPTAKIPKQAVLIEQRGPTPLLPKVKRAIWRNR